MMVDFEIPLEFDVDGTATARRENLEMTLDRRSNHSCGFSFNGLVPRDISGMWDVDPESPISLGHLYGVCALYVETRDFRLTYGVVQRARVVTALVSMLPPDGMYCRARNTFIEAEIVRLAYWVARIVTGATDNADIAAAILHGTEHDSASVRAHLARLFEVHHCRTMSVVHYSFDARYDYACSTCGNVVRTTREFTRSGLCVRCQDSLFGLRVCGACGAVTNPRDLATVPHYGCCNEVPSSCCICCGRRHSRSITCDEVPHFIARYFESEMAECDVPFVTVVWHDGTFVSELQESNVSEETPDSECTTDDGAEKTDDDAELYGAAHREVTNIVGETLRKYGDDLRTDFKFGLEVECGTQYTQQLRSLGWYTQYDSSLVIKDAVELVSRVLTLDEVRNTLAESALYLMLSRANHTCGLHVHISVEPKLSWFDVYKVLVYFKVCEEFFFATQPEGRRNGCYSTKSVCPVGAFTKKEFLRTLYGSDSSIRASCGTKYPERDAQLSRYQWVNVHSLLYHGTIEFRLHEGTTSPVEIWNWVVTLAYCMDHAIHVTPDKWRHPLDVVPQHVRFYLQDRIETFSGDNVPDCPLHVGRAVITGRGCEEVEYDSTFRKVVRRKTAKGRRKEQYDEE